MKNFAQPPPARTGSARWLDKSRAAGFEASETDAYRIYTGPFGWVERLGSDALVSHKTADAREELAAGVRDWSATNGDPIRRIFTKFLPKQNEDRAAPLLLDGPAGEPLESVVKENGVRYGLDFAAGYSAGLFIDQRENRAFVRRKAPRRMLNTFSYTCSFSVVAALCGAVTVSMDLSRKSLDRGAKNFELNGLDPAAHRFLAGDVMELLPRFARKGEKFDCIILDPPTFSRGEKGRRFNVQDDFEELVSAALEVSSPGARILLSTNCTGLGKRDLEAVARHCLKLVRMTGSFHSEADLSDIPIESAAKTLWLALH